MSDREVFEAWVKSRGGSVMKRDRRYVESMTRLWEDCWKACSEHYESRLADLSLRWKNHCEEVERAARRAVPEKVEPVVSTLEQEAISHMLEIRRIQRSIDEDRDALTDEELTQGASWITWHVDALNSVIDRIAAPQPQEQK